MRHPGKTSTTLLFISMLALAAGSASAAAGDGTPGDPNILYVGRWDKSNASVSHSYWGGAYFRTGFKGTRVKVKLAAKVDVAVSIDGGAEKIYKGATGTLDLTPSALASKDHTLRVAARNQADEIQFQGLVLDAGATTVAAAPNNGILEFIGNSITTGEKTTNTDITAFAWLAGETMKYDHTQISYGGITLVDGYHYTYSAAPLIGQSVQFFRMTTPSLNGKTAVKDVDWDFTRYAPKAVIINIGTNDRSTGVAAALFKTTYAAFVKNIRAKYPNAEIVAMRTFGGFFEKETQAVVTEGVAGGDKKLHYVDTKDWLGTGDFADDLHPNDAGHVKAANKLVAALKPILEASTSAAEAPGKMGNLGTTGTRDEFSDVKGRRLQAREKGARKGVAVKLPTGK